MRHPKKIARPTLPDARPLSALEMNALKFTDKHTVLTPEYLEKMREATTAAKPSSGQS